MDTRKLGSLNVSVIGLGCNNFGARLDLAGTKNVLDACIDNGVTFLDTADIYGATESETLMGQALKGRRDQVVLATKFGMANDKAGLTGGAHPEYIGNAIEASLRRLQTDYIDLYQLHKPDDSVPIADTLGALKVQVDAGKVREIGCSNFSTEQLEEAERVAAEQGLPRFVSVQNEYSMLRRAPEADVLATCRALDVGFLPFFPLLSGILSGKYRKGKPMPEGTRVTGSERWEAYLTDNTLDLIEELVAFANVRGYELLDLAFAWLLSEGAVKSVIAGAMNAAQVRRNAQAATCKLSESDKAQVNALLEQYGFPAGQ